MTLAIIGRKAGMTRVFTDAGEAIPVTVIECTPNRVTQVKTVETDGYNAVQVAVGEQKPGRVNKALTGHYKKAGVAAGRGLWEIRLNGEEGGDLQLGSEIKVDSFDGVKAVDVTGTSIGKGFAGVMKRHNFRGGRATHGNSLSHRVPGSIGQRQSPGKVWKNKKMAGHMGNERVTTLNLVLVKVDAERNLLLIKGAVPGAPNGDVIVRPTVK
ncbi:50S ribosomal protein L3 [Stenotrophobium rhamnosiphilum]|uniref:Large ribosomal subunit protein uL3 n=1 Tax=Stenotrophobium rhamnosiphilum TaxID=2029166 RepID=A0A2T5MBS9_9GAMM|nr:50S ribosomal protein L3 [Stenotrophobium rhamnosiphilum]PTU30012.1 50S ribosomal protein L3 [Stenotrophobium rhamnosiphilum]